MTGIRDWAEEGATPEELALLDASRSEKPGADARSRTLAALGLGAVLTAATPTTAAAAATTASGTLGVVGKIAIVLLVGGSAAGGLALYSRQEARDIAPKEPAVAAPVVPSVVSAEVEAAPAASPAVVAPPAPAPRAVAIQGPKPRASAASSSDTLAKEVAALEKAQAALAARNPDAALRALDRYKAQFPSGALASEATVLRVKAELARGDKKRAATLANELRTSHPDSPFVEGVDDLVSKEAAPKR